MSKQNTDRNNDLVKKRNSDPKKWTWGELGIFFNIHRSTAQKIYKNLTNTKV